MRRGLRGFVPFFVVIMLAVPSLTANVAPNKGSCSNDMVSELAKVGLFVAGAYSVYAIASAISGVLTMSVSMLPNYMTAGILGILLPVLGTIGVVFVMWFLTYTLLKEK